MEQFQQSERMCQSKKNYLNIIIVVHAHLPNFFALWYFSLLQFAVQSHYKQADIV